MDALFDQIFKLVPLSAINIILNIAIIAILFHGIRPWLRELAAQVKKTNGTVIELKQWKDDHNGSDDQRHRENLARLAEINAAMRDLGRK